MVESITNNNSDIKQDTDIIPSTENGGSGDDNIAPTNNINGDNTTTTTTTTTAMMTAQQQQQPQEQDSGADVGVAAAADEVVAAGAETQKAPSAEDAMMSTGGAEVASAQEVMDSARRTLDTQISALSDRDPVIASQQQQQQQHRRKSSINKLGIDGSSPQQQQQQQQQQGRRKSTTFSDQCVVATNYDDIDDDDVDDETDIDQDEFDDAKTSVTFGGQTELPPLPIPSLEETLNKFLKSLEALQEYEGQKQTAKRVVLEFLQTDGPALQRLLVDYDRNGRRQGRIGSYVEEFWNDAYLAPDASVVMVRVWSHSLCIRNHFLFSSTNLYLLYSPPSSD
jgi:hypothetical protein